MIIAIFASGNGSNFEALVNAVQKGEIPGCEIALCICDRPGAFVCERARRLGIPVLQLRPKDFPSKRDYEKKIADELEKLGVDLICLAGYMRIIGNELLHRFNRRIINLHPSLLPAFPGAHAIRDAFEYGVKVFGVTIHYVNEVLDGGTIIAQEAVPYEGTDIEALETLIHQAEHRLYPRVIRKLINDKKDN